MSTKMTELLIKMENKHILNAILLSELMSLNCSEISTYKKSTFRTEERTECDWYIIENSYKNQKSIFSIRTSIPKFLECYPFLIHCSGIFGGKRNIGNTSRKYIIW